MIFKIFNSDLNELFVHNIPVLVKNWFVHLAYYFLKINANDEEISFMTSITKTSANHLKCTVVFNFLFTHILFHFILHTIICYLLRHFFF